MCDKLLGSPSTCSLSVLIILSLILSLTIFYIYLCDQSISLDLNPVFPHFLSLNQCLCVSPTYELALQTGKVIEQMGKHYPEVKLVYAIRGNKCKGFLLSNIFK